jgi:murein endopeptidase
MLPPFALHRRLQIPEVLLRGFAGFLTALLVVAVGGAASGAEPASCPAAAAEAPAEALPPANDAPVLADDDLGGDESDDGDDGDDGESPPEARDPEAEPHESGPAVPGGPRYTADLSDEDLAAAWKQDPARLGSISVGFTDAGRMLNSEPFPREGNWIVVDPANAYGTRETIDYLTTAIGAVCSQFPESPPIRVNHISRKDGGWLRPHQSHQSGRDADLGFYYPTAEPVRARERERYIDVARNWGLLRALVTLTDVQVVLVDRRVQKVLYDHALELGEDRDWLDSLFRSGSRSLVQHARRHRDHFHVRFFNPRAQELGRRVHPFLLQQPDQNVARHRVRRGDTLGHIARKYGTSVAALRKANGLRSSSLLSLGRTLQVPLRGPCTRCPQPPEVVVPARRLPPTRLIAQEGGIPSRPATFAGEY